ncbi:hypothetical protein [Silvimonas amylolytica]|uniref:hypothetical protein n=1 Tax=Silvimonas amylolytica TaxID=449663 RepID=UPI001E471C76|nr:hypothetical protein [Silvimonas amylolytica]
MNDLLMARPFGFKTQAARYGVASRLRYQYRGATCALYRTACVMNAGVQRP